MKSSSHRKPWTFPNPVGIAYTIFFVVVIIPIVKVHPTQFIDIHTTTVVKFVVGFLNLVIVQIVGMIQNLFVDNELGSDAATELPQSVWVHSVVVSFRYFAVGPCLMVMSQNVAAAFQWRCRPLCP